MNVSCQCGGTCFKTPLAEPLALYICHCDGCRRQSGSAFGTSAIFPRFKLPENSPIRVYTRKTLSGHTMYCYFCQNCGTRLLHATPNKNIVSVKGGCIQGLDWSKAVHIWTNSAMVPIPEGSETYSEESEEGEFGYHQGQPVQPFHESSGPSAVVTCDDEGEPTGSIRGACELSCKRFS